MNIGLISDTHIPEAMLVPSVQRRQIFADTELILHAGDLHCFAVLDWWEELAPVLAAHGNEDSGSGGRSVVPEDPQLREAQVVWYHGWTVPRNWQAQPGTVGILRLEEGHRANVTISDVQTLQPYQAFHTTAVRSH